MLQLTQRKPVVGCAVGYYDGWNAEKNEFPSEHVGEVIDIVVDSNGVDMYEVKFPDGSDRYYENQLVLLH